MSKPLKKRNLGLDLLKAILAFLIVIRHSAVISIVPLESAGGGYSCIAYKISVFFDSKYVCANFYGCLTGFLYTEKSC